MYNYCTLVMQGLTTPFPRFVKLNPTIPDLSIPELLHRVQLENAKENVGLSQLPSRKRSNPRQTVMFVMFLASNC